MKKSTILILVLVFLAACQQTAVAQEKEPRDFRFGSEGIVLTWMPNQPPPQFVFQDARTTPLRVALRVENRGTYDIGPGQNRIYLSGFDTNLIQFRDLSPTGRGSTVNGKTMEALTGRGPFTPRGQFYIMTESGLINWPSGVPRIDTPIIATTCYGYRTQASGQVCIDQDPFSSASRVKSCTPTSVSLGSQGAPIAVTNINLEATRGKTYFDITVSNIGGGVVFKDETAIMNKCNPHQSGFEISDRDVLKIVGVDIGGSSILPSCQLQDGNLLYLYGGSATFQCSYDTSRGQNTYTTPIQITAQYGYQQSITTNVQIRQAGTR